MIVHEGGKYHVKSENGSKHLGTYNTKEEAEQTIKKQYRRILLSIKEVKECLPR